MFRLFLPLLLLASGCPTTDVPSGVPGAVGGLPPPTSPGEPGGQPGGAQPPPPDGTPAAAPGAPTGESAGALDPGDPALSAPPGKPAPGFASLIQGGPTVTISGTLVGAKDAQVDFTRVKEKDGRKLPEPLEILKVTDGKFKLEAPAILSGEIWVTAMTTGPDGGLGGKAGVATAPIRLEGKDVSVTIQLGDGPDWMAVLPWHEANMPLAGAALDPAAGALPTPPNPPP